MVIEMLDFASRSIGFRDEAATLKGMFPALEHAGCNCCTYLSNVVVADSLMICQRQNKELETKLGDTERALKEAEARALTAESKLSDKSKEVSSREAGIKKRLDELTASFGSKSEFSSSWYFAAVTWRPVQSFLFGLQQKNLVSNLH